MNEIWKDIKGYKGIYMISNHGKLKSFNRNKKGKILKRGSEPYHTVCLCNEGHKIKYVHLLVAEYFIDNPLNKKHVNHKDGNKLNNHYTNLEWSTKKEDVQHAYDTGLITQKKGGECTASKKVNKYNVNGNFIKQYDSQTIAYEKTGVKQSHISACCTYKLKTAGGYIWKFIEDAL